jgi:uncharacterized membrane protein
MGCTLRSPSWCSEGMVYQSLIEELRVPRSLRERAADSVAKLVGSWSFVLAQTSLVVGWVLVNLVGSRVWDPYPFVLMNVMLSLQAAYTAPIIMMSQNRQGKVDRDEARLDYETNRHTGRMVQAVLLKLELQEARLEEQAGELAQLRALLDP